MQIAFADSQLISLLLALLVVISLLLATSFTSSNIFNTDRVRGLAATRDAARVSDTPAPLRRAATAAAAPATAAPRGALRYGPTEASQLY